MRWDPLGGVRPVKVVSDGLREHECRQESHRCGDESHGFRWIFPFHDQDRCLEDLLGEVPLSLRMQEYHLRANPVSGAIPVPLLRTHHGASGVHEAPLLQGSWSVGLRGSSIKIWRIRARACSGQ